MFSFLPHQRARTKKETPFQQSLACLPSSYYTPLSLTEQGLIDQPVSRIVAQVHTQTLKPDAALLAYGKQALRAHNQTNCLTEVMIGDAHESVRRSTKLTADGYDGYDEATVNLSGPLAGVPVSVKDTVVVRGYDACIGYARYVGMPKQNDAPLVRLLRDAGAVPFVKTNVPTTLLSFESTNAVHGRTTHPHNALYTPGGSSSGEAALLALRGSPLGIGTDVAGSVRIPAHYSGICAMKASVGRFPKTGCLTSMPGQEGVPPVYSPMAGRVEDLEYFWRALGGMGMWRYDHTVIEMPWKPVNLEGTKLRCGVMWDDGVVAPSPACHRALRTVVDALKAAGHEVIDVEPPSPFRGLLIASQLLLADGCQTASAPLLPFEPTDPGMRSSNALLRLPRWANWLVRKLYSTYLRYIKRDEMYAQLVEGWYEKSVTEYWALVARREEYRAEWFAWWDAQSRLFSSSTSPVKATASVSESWASASLSTSTDSKSDESDTGAMDFILTPPNALPAVQHGDMRTAWKTCGYTFLFNLLDYTAGVVPVTTVDESLDSEAPLTSGSSSSTNTRNWAQPSRNKVEQDARELYDPISMHGLPVGVQIVGRRLQEEKVLAGMGVVCDLVGGSRKGGSQ